MIENLFLKFNSMVKRSERVQASRKKEAEQCAAEQALIKLGNG